MKMEVKGSDIVKILIRQKLITLTYVQNGATMHQDPAWCGSVCVYV